MIFSSKESFSPCKQWVPSSDLSIADPQRATSTLKYPTNDTKYYFVLVRTIHCQFSTIAWVFPCGAYSDTGPIVQQNISVILWTRLLIWPESSMKMTFSLAFGFDYKKTITHKGEVKMSTLTMSPKKTL